MGTGLSYDHALGFITTERASTIAAIIRRKVELLLRYIHLGAGNSVQISTSIGRMRYFDPRVDYEELQIIKACNGISKNEHY